ncbi:MAG: DUF1684 domain-containing protein [Bacteroidota bacterium]
MWLRCFGFVICLMIGNPVFAQSTFKKEVKQHRRNYKAGFLTQKPSPLDSTEVEKVCFFRPKQSFQIDGIFTKIINAEPFDMPTYDGAVQPYIAYGRLAFVIGKDSLELTVYRNLKLLRLPMYRDRLFLPFKDQTNQNTTYGGGRYLDFKISDIQDGKLTIDFNKAYNPYCAYSDGFICPIPPTENHLEVKIKAGEKNFNK